MAGIGKLTLEAHHNPQYDFSQPRSMHNEPYLYRVVKAQNTVACDIHQTLTKQQVQDYIDNGLDVTVQPAK
jgi:hypothetical protein